MTRIACSVVALAVLFVAACSRERTPRYHPALGGPEFYTSDAFTGTVVDSTSGRPVPDAVVVAVWRKVQLPFHSWAGVFRRHESRTDTAGRFIVERWGPRARPANGYVDARAPELWVIRRGYLVGYFDNAGAKRPRVPMKMLRGDGDAAGLFLMTLPPGRSSAEERSQRIRAAVAGSVWAGKTLPVVRAKSAEEVAESIAGASPYDPFVEVPGHFAVPAFEAEWALMHHSLPPELKALFTRPRSLADVAVVNTRLK